MVLQVVCKPGTVKTHQKFEAEVYILTKEEGGRHTAFFSNYRPQFYLRTADVTGKVELPEHIKMVMPGDNLTAQFELIIPCPLETGTMSSQSFCILFSVPNLNLSATLFFDRKYFLLFGTIVSVLPPGAVAPFFTSVTVEFQLSVPSEP